MSVLVLVLLPIVLLIIGVPIFVALMAIAIVGVWIVDSPLHAVHTSMFGSLDSFPLLAVPLFIFAGDIMARGGMARRLIEFMLSLVGGIRGSLGLATIASCEAFGVMSGSSVACVAAIGKLTVPALRKNGYGETFSVSLVTASGVIDVIIPPSIPMIIYAIAAQQSVADLFLAGFLPRSWSASYSRPMCTSTRDGTKSRSAPRRGGTISGMPRKRRSGPCSPVVILGGIYGGVFTPTEAAGAAYIYAIVISMFVYREMSLADLWQITLDSAALIAQILVIVSAAGAFAWLITTSGLPTKLIMFVDGLGLQYWMLLVVINVLLLFVGSALEPPAAILILTPCSRRLPTRPGSTRSTSGSSSPSISRSACSCRRSG